MKINIHIFGTCAKYVQIPYMHSRVENRLFNEVFFPEQINLWGRSPTTTLR